MFSYTHKQIMHVCARTQQSWSSMYKLPTWQQFLDSRQYQHATGQQHVNHKFSKVLEIQLPCTALMQHMTAASDQIRQVNMSKVISLCQHLFASHIKVLGNTLGIT